MNVTVKMNDPMDPLVLAALAGNQDAWRELVEQLNHPLTAFLSARGNRDDTQEAIQSTWAKTAAAVRKGKFDPRDSPGASFRGFLYTVAHNELTSIHRRKRPDQPGEDFDFGDDSPSGEENAIKNEELQIMKECIEQLPEDQRTLIVMRMTMSAKTVAAALGIPAGTVHSGFHRVCKRVRMCMERKQTGGNSR